MATIHITRGTTSLGTFSEDEVREGLRTGRFVSNDLGWKEGMATWEPLSKFSEFAGAARRRQPQQPRLPQFREWPRPHAADCLGTGDKSWAWSKPLSTRC